MPIPSPSRAALAELAAEAACLFAELRCLGPLNAEERDAALWKLMSAGPLAAVANNLAHSDAGACMLAQWLATWEYGGRSTAALRDLDDLDEWKRDSWAIECEARLPGIRPLNRWVQYRRLIREAPGLLLVANPTGLSLPKPENIASVVEGFKRVTDPATLPELKSHPILCTPPQPFVLKFIRSLYRRPESCLAVWAPAARVVVLFDARRAKALEGVGVDLGTSDAKAAGLLKAKTALAAREEAAAELAAATRKLAAADVLVCQTRAAAIALSAHHRWPLAAKSP